MRVYWEVARVGFKRYATYRSATAAGIFTNTIFGFMLAYIQVALFAARGPVAGYGATDAVTYVWITQAMLAMVAAWAWIEIAQRIRTGDIATDFERPVDFQLYWLAQDLGRAAFQVVFRGIPPVLIALLFFRLRFPADAITWLLFAVSLLLAVIVSFGLRFLTNLMAFWIADHRGLISITGFLWPVLGGLWGIPLVYMPHGVFRVLSLLPFAAMGQAPLTVYLGKPGIVQTMALQLVWAVLLLALGRLVLRRAERRLVVQGG